jgi:hypothetical protein
MGYQLILNVRGISFPAGLGTILIFIGIYCFKAAFSKRRYTDKDHATTGKPLHTKNKLAFCLAGSISVIGGVLLIVKSFPKDL